MISTMIDNFTNIGIINSKDIPTLEKEANNNNRRIIFIDSTFVLPNSHEDIYKNYSTKRINNSVFFDLKFISNKNSLYPNMLPSKKDFSKYVSELRINNSDILIIYGQHGMLMGPARAWWMFKGFGHNNVIVLNGGLPAWENEGFAIETNSPKSYKKSEYTASNFNSEAIIDMAEVLEASKNKLCPIIDARPKERFSGKTPEPRESMRSGHIPNSKNIPCSMLVDKDGKFKTKGQLIKIFKTCDINLSYKESRIITTCGSGITACALHLALHYVGHKNVAVYDGSWSEWGLETSLTPIAKIND